MGLRGSISIDRDVGAVAEVLMNVLQRTGGNGTTAGPGENVDFASYPDL